MTGFFGSTGNNVFFDVVLVDGFLDADANGATLAVFRSTLRGAGTTAAVVIAVNARTSMSVLICSSFPLSILNSSGFDNLLQNFFNPIRGGNSFDRMAIFVRFFLVPF